MSRFRVPLHVTGPAADGRTWTLTEPFAYEVGHLGSGDVVEAPAGLRTDFASVPQFLWWFAAPIGDHTWAAVIHDVLYKLQTRSRRESDRIFLEAMGVLNVWWFKRWAMWAAVRSPFGALAWRANARNGAALHIVDVDTLPDARWTLTPR